MSLRKLFKFSSTLGNSNDKGMIKDQHIWSPSECVQVMISSLTALYQRFQVFIFHQKMTEKLVQEIFIENN